MGNSRFDYGSYTAHTKSYAGKSVDEYTSDSLNPNLNPVNIKLRESRDSDANPESNAIILGMDFTGSMSFVADYMAKEGIARMCKGIYDKKPISDPHIMVMGIGDIEWDSAPLQVSQFEADIKIAKDLELMWIHHGGGGNSVESYTLPWLFAASRTSIDCFEKRQRKGYLFTCGDEMINPVLRKSHLARVMGKVEKDFFKDWTAEELYALVSEKYHVFHVIAEEGTDGKNKSTHDSWVKVVGQNLIHMPDHKKFSEIIITSIMIKEGMDKEEALKAWDKETAAQIKTAVNFRK